MPDDLINRRPDSLSAPVPTSGDPSAPVLPAETLTKVAGAAARSRSESTRRNYTADW